MNEIKTKKKFPLGIKIAIVLIALTVTYFSLRLTGALDFYRVGSSACEPKFSVGQIIFASNLKTFKRNDFVCYKAIPSPTENESASDIYPSQLIAFEGETLEIKNSLAYVNGQLVDDSMKLKFAWIIPAGTYSMNNLPTEQDQVLLNDTGGYFQLLTIKEGISKNYKRWNIPKGARSNGLWKAGENDWTRDNFGPFVVPKGYVFLLSPNRANALDSRYRGPIPVENILATILN